MVASHIGLGFNLILQVALGGCKKQGEVVQSSVNCGAFDAEGVTSGACSGLGWDWQYTPLSHVHAACIIL